MKSVSIKGVLIGGIVDIVSSFVLGIPFAIYAIASVYLSHLPPDKVGPAVSAVLGGNSPLYWGQVFVGMCCSVLGGYVAAWIAGHHERLNGTLSAFLCVSLGIFAIAASKDSHPMYVQILLLAAGPALGLLGGYMRYKQKSPTTAEV
ncbi:MAG: hypothetical protein ABSF28_01795 [Terracidiphilus sp.]|jgi:hypothetical protein